MKKHPFEVRGYIIFTAYVLCECMKNWRIVWDGN